MKKISFLSSIILGIILFAFISVPQAHGVGVCDTAFTNCIVNLDPGSCALKAACTAACAPYYLLNKAPTNCVCVDNGQCASNYCNKVIGPFGVCKPVANCTCDEPNSGLGFTCTSGGKTYHGACTDASKVCRDVPGRRPDDGLLAFLPDIKALFSGAAVAGIDCGNRSLLSQILNRPTQPPPPSPPCANFANGSCTSVQTAFGNVSTEPGGFVTRVAGILIAAAGSIAVLLFMRAGYRIMTARGNPEGLQQGREQLTAAIVGLLFIIFSFVILEVIGVDLLQIPGTLPSPVKPGSGGSGGSTATCTGIRGSCISSSQCSQEGGINRGKLDCEGGGVVCCQPAGSTPGSCTVAGGSCISSTACSGEKNLGKLDCEGGGVVCCQPTGSTPGTCTEADGSCISGSVCNSEGKTNLGKLDCEGGGVVCCR